MKVISFLSDFCMPFVVCWIVIYGWLGGCPVFDVFVKGAKRGLRTVAGILPTLIGLMAAVRILRDSGLLDRIAGLLSPLAGILRIPAEVLPLLLVKMFSASAATGILLDILKIPVLIPMRGCWLPLLLLPRKRFCLSCRCILPMYISAKADGFCRCRCCACLQGCWPQSG